MATVSISNQGFINQLATEYNALSPIKKSFFPPSLKLFIEQHPFAELTQANQIDITQLLIFFQLLRSNYYIGHTFGSLRRFYNTPLFQSLSLLRKAGFLNGTYAEIVTASNFPLVLATSLVQLRTEVLLTEEEHITLARALINAVYPDKIVSILILLRQQGLLQLQRAINVTACNDLDNLLAILDIMMETNLLLGEHAESNLDRVLNYHYLNGLGPTIALLKQHNMLAGEWAQDNFEKALYTSASGANFDHPPASRFELVEMVRIISGLTSTLTILEHCGLFNDDQRQNNFDLVTAVSDPAQCARVIQFLSTESLITDGNRQAIFEAVLAHQNHQKLHHALTILRRLGFLNQDNLFWALSVGVQKILFHDDIVTIWDRIPPHRLTPERFAQIQEYCERFKQDPLEGRRQITGFINREILQLGHQTALDLNTKQSTHTESIHISTSETARTLMRLYGSQAGNLASIFGEIHDWLDQQPDTSAPYSPLKSARICFNNLRKPLYAFTDPLSGVSIQQLLALIWVAIQDDSKRLSSLPDARQQFLNALYECQRGYNISKAGVDRGGPDKPICLSGSFNKHVEKLKGVHADANIIFITPKTASNKFQVVVREEALGYLREQMNTLSPDTFSSLLQSVIKDGVNLIWEQIRQPVTDRILEEFGPSLYPEGSQSSAFKSLLSTAQYAAITPSRLKAKEKELTESPACHTSPLHFFDAQAAETDASEQEKIQVEAPCGSVDW